MCHLLSHWLWFDFASELAALSCAASQSHCGQFRKPVMALRLCDRSDVLLSALVHCQHCSLTSN